MGSLKNLWLVLICSTLGCSNYSASDSKQILPSGNDIEIISSKTVNENDTVQKQQQLKKKETAIILKNNADYSLGFIQELKGLGYSRIELIDSFIIMDNKDTIAFPTTPKIGAQIVYTGRKDNLAIALTVKCTNYSSLEYQIEMVEFGKANYKDFGKADLTANFFLAAEVDVDERTGDSYFAAEFINRMKNSCYSQIRIGQENEQAKIIKNCNGEIKAITLDNFSNLYKK